MSDVDPLKPTDLIRRLRRLATRRGWHIEIKEGGRNTKLPLNGRRTTIPRYATDLGSGLLQAIRKQLGLAAGDLEE